jgi:hypothetical protein
MPCGHDATVDHTNILQACRSHPSTSTVWTRHMRRPEVQSCRQPDVPTRRATVVWGHVHVPYARVCKQESMRADSDHGRVGPSHPAQLGQAGQVAREGGLQLFSASHLPAHEHGHLVHSPHACNGTGGVGGGGGEGRKHSPARCSDSSLTLVPVAVHHGSTVRAARRPAKRNTRSGQSTGGRHQRGGATGGAEHLQPRSVRSSGRR